MDDNTETGKIIIHISDLFTESDKFMEKRIENAYKAGGYIEFWQKFFFCNDMHTSCKKFFYLFTERQLFILREWVKKNTKDENIKNLLEMSLQNCFTKVWRLKDSKKIIKIQNIIYCIKKEPTGPKKISFIQKLIKVIFKLPVGDEKSNPQSPNFFIENWSSEGINDERKKYMEELLGTTLKNTAAQEILGRINNINSRLLYLGDDCGYDHPILIYCDKLNVTCPFYDTKSSLEQAHSA